ncbi:hypothetical protein AB0K51_05085 [Kitasatospora sp. NPDC049285]|uniref:hypothetical protein n=1 Tax=Kitasatospora sp. NPDC049285 TaxID=3157096 RepID=UPI0034382D31
MTAPPPTVRLADGVERRDRDGIVVLAAPAGRSYSELPVRLLPLLDALDGTRTADELSGRFGPEAVEVITGLRGHGFLADSPPVRVRRVALTSDGLEVMGAHRIVRRLTDLLPRRVRVAVGWSALALTGPSLVLAAVHTAGPAPVSALDPLPAGLVLLAVAFGLIVIHEIAHALVLAHHGRDIGVVGVGLYWGAPCFYVDASAVLLLPRRARIAQAAAGSVADAVLGGLLVLSTHWFPEPVWVAVGTWGSALCLSTVAVNLAPVLELDGYWLLCDLLGVRDLFGRSMAALRDVLRRQGVRQDRGLALYAVASLVVGVGFGAAAAWAWWSSAGTVVGALWWHGVGATTIALVLSVPVAAPLLQPAVALLGRVRSGPRAAR